MQIEVKLGVWALLEASEGDGGGLVAGGAPLHYVSTMHLFLVLLRRNSGATARPRRMLWR